LPAVDNVQSKKKRGRPVKRLILMVLIGAALWSGHWVWQARSTENALERWFEARRAEGWTARYDSLSIHGFPNRVDARFTGVELSNPDTGHSWEAAEFQLLTLVYNRDHRILVFPDQHVLRSGGQTYRLQGEGLIASVNGTDGVLGRAGLQAETLNIKGPRGDLAVAGLSAGIHTNEAAPQQLLIGLTANALAGSKPATLLSDQDSAKALDLRAILHLDAPWPMRPEASRPAPTRLDLQLAEYRLDQMWLKASGDWDIDKKGRLDGDMSLRAENWRGALDKAILRGDIPKEIGGAISDALALVSQLSGKADTLDLKLGFNDGRMSMGLIPLGDAPRLRLP
jgi:hypothetical protein